MPKILVAVDGSDVSLDAVRHALALKAQGLKASLVLANVQEPPSLYEMLTVRDAARLGDLGSGAGQHLLQGARQLCDAAAVPYELEVATGDPAHTLVDIAEQYGCAMIIAGARGKGATAGGWLGSVSHELMHVSPIPVTVVKHAEAVEAQADDAAAETSSTLAEEEAGMLGLA